MKGLFWAISVLWGIHAAAQDTLINTFDDQGRKQGYWIDSILSIDKKHKYLLGAGNYLAGLREGRYIDYYEDGGGVLSDNMFHHDTLHGERKIYRRDGTLFQIENHNMGRLQGVKKFFDPDGILDAEVEYKDGLPTGSCTFFYKNGRKRLVTTTIMVGSIPYKIQDNFSDDEKNQLVARETFVNDNLIEKVWYKDGKVIKKE